MQLKFSNCFHVTHPGNAVLLEWDEHVDVESVRCPKFPLHRRSGKRKGPLLLKGKKLEPDECAWTWQSEIIIGQEVARALEKSGINSIDLVPAFLDGVQVFELRVTGYAGNASPKSGIRLAKYCDACGLKIYTCFKDPSYLVEPSAWGRNDLFFVWPLPKLIFATPKAKSLLGNFKGLIFESPLELRCEGTLTPGELSYYR
jgi:hypothetical protein